MSLYPNELLLMSVKMIFILEKWQLEKPWPSPHGSKELELVMVSPQHCNLYTVQKFHMQNQVLTKIILHSADLLAEVSRREKEANIKPDPDIDVYMKVRHI